jgi:hypothetical protein
MRVMITTSGGTMNQHNKILDILNSIYELNEQGANGGHGDYFSNGDNDYLHVKKHFRHESKLGHVFIVIETLIDDDDEIDDEVDDDEN